MFFFVSIQFCRVVVVIDKQMSQRQLSSWFISSPFAQRWKIKYKTLRYLGTSSVRMYQSNRRLLRMICLFWTFKSLCRSFSSFFYFEKCFQVIVLFFLLIESHAIRFDLAVVVVIPSICVPVYSCLILPMGHFHQTMMICFWCDAQCNHSAWMWERVRMSPGPLFRSHSDFLFISL